MVRILHNFTHKVGIMRTLILAEPVSLDFGAEEAAAAGVPLDDEVVVVAVAEAAEDATAAARAVDL